LASPASPVVFSTGVNHQKLGTSQINVSDAAADITWFNYMQTPKEQLTEATRQTPCNRSSHIKFGKHLQAMLWDASSLCWELKERLARGSLL
jgi:hypothetical protein